jgi:hypothetical protein
LAPVKRAGAREGGIARAGAGAKWRLLAPEPELSAERRRGERERMKREESPSTRARTRKARKE